MQNIHVQHQPWWSQANTLAFRTHHDQLFPLAHRPCLFHTQCSNERQSHVLPLLPTHFHYLSPCGLTPTLSQIIVPNPPPVLRGLLPKSSTPEMVPSCQQWLLLTKIWFYQCWPKSLHAIGELWRAPKTIYSTCVSENLWGSPIFAGPFTLDSCH